MEPKPDPPSVRPLATRILALSAFFMVGMSCLSCSFDYGGLPGADAREEPSAIFSDFVHRVVDKGSLVLEVRAARAEAYDSSHRTILTDVAFSQFASNGDLAATGTADAATLFTDSEDAEFRGRVRLQSKTEDSVLEAEQLTWISDSKTIRGGLERIVSIRRGDGAWVRGAGFEAEMLSRSFSFQEASEGRIVTADKEAASDEARSPPGNAAGSIP